MTSNESKSKQELTTDDCYDFVQTFPFSHMSCADSKRRATCSLCLRPSTFCICKFCPPEPLQLPSNIAIWILQHPNERKRPLSTTKILNRCISGIKIVQGHKFSKESSPHLPFDESTFVVYPDSGSTLETISMSEFDVIKLIFVDGTWNEAKRIVKSNPDLISLRRISIKSNDTSAFIIRSQPRKIYLSTLEAIAEVLATLWDPKIKVILLLPLRNMCKLQIDCGAEHHQSQEQRILEGLYNRPISKKRLKFLTGQNHSLSEKKK